MILPRLEMTSPSAVNLQIWGVHLQHPICMGSDALPHPVKRTFTNPFHARHVREQGTCTYRLEARVAWFKAA